MLRHTFTASLQQGFILIPIPRLISHPKKKKKKNFSYQHYALYILETTFHRPIFFLLLQMSLICFIRFMHKFSLFEEIEQTNLYRLLCYLRPRALIGNRLRLETAIMKARGRNLLGTSAYIDNIHSQRILMPFEDREPTGLKVDIAHGSFHVSYQITARRLFSLLPANSCFGLYYAQHYSLGVLRKLTWLVFVSYLMPYIFCFQCLSRRSLKEQRRQKRYELALF